MAGIGEGQRRQGGRPLGQPPRAQFPPRPRFEPVDREKVYMVFLTFPRVSDFVPWKSFFDSLWIALLADLSIVASRFHQGILVVQSCGVNYLCSFDKFSIGFCVCKCCYNFCWILWRLGVIMVMKTLQWEARSPRMKFKSIPGRMRLFAS